MTKQGVPVPSLPDFMDNFINLFFLPTKIWESFGKVFFFRTSVNFTNLCKVLEIFTFFYIDKLKNKLAANWFSFFFFFAIL